MFFVIRTIGTTLALKDPIGIGGGRVMTLASAPAEMKAAAAATMTRAARESFIMAGVF